MWFNISKTSEIQTPSLALYPDRVLKNVRQMVSQIEAVDRLVPHVKTHKSSLVLKILLAEGICKFKCATLAELSMVVNSGAEFALLAIQPTGPGVRGFANMAIESEACSLATIADNIPSLRELEAVAAERKATLTVFLDINNGMDRTGIVCGDEACQTYRYICESSRLQPGGLHVYDGHIHDRDYASRSTRVNAAMEPVLAFRDQLLQQDCSVPMLIAGGTPSFPVHAAHADRFCSPGTPVLWDAGYSEMFPDLDSFCPAAVLLTRVISKLPDNKYCLDLGYKSLAAEMQPPRASFLNADVVEECSQSEEHLVVRLGDGQLNVGDLIYALPRHICPTVAKHQEFLVVEAGNITEKWAVTARDRDY